MLNRGFQQQPSRAMPDYPAAQDKAPADLQRRPKSCARLSDNGGETVQIWVPDQKEVNAADAAGCMSISAFAGRFPAIRSKPASSS
jgi:hypothetical protein